jgi:hypothetical protein
MIDMSEPKVKVSQEELVKIASQSLAMILYGVRSRILSPKDVGEIILRSEPCNRLAILFMISDVVEPELSEAEWDEVAESIASYIKMHRRCNALVENLRRLKRLPDRVFRRISCG